MRILLMVCFLFAGIPAAHACGNPLLWAMLFSKVPEAKVVFEAELEARAEGLVEAREYNAKPGQPYHVWSKAWLMTLANEMQPTMSEVLETGETFTILLADEVAAIQFRRGEEPVFVPSSGLNSVRGFDAISTINALNGAWRQGVALDVMASRDLLKLDNRVKEKQIASLLKQTR